MRTERAYTKENHMTMTITTNVAIPDASSTVDIAISDDSPISRERAKVDDSIQTLERADAGERTKALERATCADTDISHERVSSNNNLIHFTLPALPPSVNGIYQIIWSTRSVELKPECRQWKMKAKEHMPPWRLASESSLVRIDPVFYYNFHFKNGKLKPYDTQNLLKLLIDAIAERYGFKDERVKAGSWDSIDIGKTGGREQVQVRVMEIT
jgi:hypothetical protein